MTFKISMEFTYSFDPDKNCFIINGKEVSNYDLSMLKMYGIDLITDYRRGNNITFKIPDKAMQFIKERYYRN